MAAKLEETKEEPNEEDSKSEEEDYAEKFKMFKQTSIDYYPSPAPQNARGHMVPSLQEH